MSLLEFVVFFTLWTYQLVSEQWRSIEKLEAGVQTVMEGVQPIETGSWNTEARILRMEETLREIRGFLWRLKINLWEDQRRQPLCTRGACHHTDQVIGMITNITIPQLAMQPDCLAKLSGSVFWVSRQGGWAEGCPQHHSTKRGRPTYGGNGCKRSIVRRKSHVKKGSLPSGFFYPSSSFSTSYKYCIEKRTCKAPKYIRNVTLK